VTFRRVAVTVVLSVPVFMYAVCACFVAAEFSVGLFAYAVGVGGRAVGWMVVVVFAGLVVAVLRLRDMLVRRFDCFGMRAAFDAPPVSLTAV
jgi:hypothetical protein